MATMEIWAFRGVPTTVDLEGYGVEAADGSVGTIDESTTKGRENYLVVDTGPWIFGKHVLLPAGVVERIDTADEKVFVNRSRDEIKNAPEYDPDNGATEPYRQQVGSYYAAREVGTRRSENRPKRTRRKMSSSSRRQTRASDEPTRDELYARAKRLGIEGRSKMNKAQLKRAVARRSGQSASAQARRRSPARSGKATPVEVQAFLEGVSYPTRKGDLLREAKSSGASRAVRSTLERLPEERFQDPTDVSEAIGKLR
jgi:Protein of unknown function (DUF2795)